MTQNEYGGEEKGETMGLSRGLTSNVRPKGCEKRIPNSRLRTYTQPRPSLMNVTLHDMRERALLCYLEKDRSDVAPIALVVALRSVEKLVVGSIETTKMKKRGKE